MFYSEAILSKKGPLAKVWLAAHWERKLTKNQFLQTNLHNSVDAIMGTDQAPMALRLSGQLLLGVAKIYSRKTRYLLEDCNEALVKIKVAFRPDANKGDSNLLILDGNTIDFGTDQINTAAFNAITAPDATTQFDLLLPAHTIDMNGWGLNPKLNNSTGLRDITLDEGNDDMLSMAGNNHTMDHGRRNLGLDIEVGRNRMNRIGGGGYSIMDFDLAGPDDALDLDIFGDDVAAAADPDFWKRSHRRDDLEIEVGRDAAVARRSPSVDPFGMLDAGEKQRPLHLGEGSEDGRAPAIHGQTNELGFDDFVPIQTDARAPVNFEIADGSEAGPEHQTLAKKRKLIVDQETEMTQEYTENDLVADGLLTTHEMLPRSRKLLRLQQIEQDVAHGGLAGYLLDFTAGPRVMGSALVPELASMFSRNLQIVQEAPELPELHQEGENEGTRGASAWQSDRVESWVDNTPGFNISRTTPPPIDTFDGFQLDVPRVTDNGEGSSTAVPKPAQPSLFQDMEDTSSPATTKQLLGTVFSTSTVQTMHLVQQGLESKKGLDSTQNTTTSTRTRNASIATASSPMNKDNTSRVRFSELMAGPNTQQKGSRADAAKLFFELLVLSTKDVVKVEQEESFGDISIGGSPWLETLVVADSSA